MNVPPTKPQKACTGARAEDCSSQLGVRVLIGRGEEDIQEPPESHREVARDEDKHCTERKMHS